MLTCSQEGPGEEAESSGALSDGEREEALDASSWEEVQRGASAAPASQLAGQVAEFGRPSVGATGVQIAPQMYGGGAPLMLTADSIMQTRRMLAPAVLPGVRPIWPAMNVLASHYAHVGAPQLHAAVALPYGMSMQARPLQGVPLVRQPLHVWRVPEASNRSFQTKKKTR